MGKLKFYILLTLGALALLPVRADEKSKALLGTLSAEMASYKSYEIAFTSSMPGEFEGLEGRMTVSGERYCIAAGDVEIYYDGKTRWTYNRTQKEVLCEKPGSAQIGLLDNPARFFKLYDTDFTHTYKGPGTWNGKKVEQIELTPRTPGEGYDQILLRLDAATGDPLSVRYGSSPPLEITIRTLTPNVPVSDATFTFDPKQHKGVEVIDFR